MSAEQNSETLGHMLDAVRSYDHPVKPSELKKKGLSEKAVKNLLGQLANEKQVYRWQKGRSIAYWRFPAEQYVAEKLLDLAGERAMERKELAKAVAKRCFNFPQTKCETVVKQLLQSGDLKDLQEAGSPKKLVFASKRPQAYLQTLAEKITPSLDAIEKFGARREEFFEILRGRPQRDSRNDAERVFEALQQSQPEAGVHVPVRELREHPLVKDLSKEEFDAAVLQLAQQQRIDTAAHDDAFNLSPESRQGLVFREPNTYYVAVAVRT